MNKLEITEEIVNNWISIATYEIQKSNLTISAEKKKSETLLNFLKIKEIISKKKLDLGK